MYSEFFSIEEEAFSIAPNPRYLYLSAKHREAYAHLLYGVTRPGGFVLLTGDIGTGKTTLCRSLFATPPANTDLAVIINPALSPTELLSAICDEFSISYSKYQNNTKVYIDRINRHLLDNHAEGRNAVLLIDEAQNLSVEALESIRALTNLETDEKKLLQIILVGQPELRSLLAKPELEQLNQRITARYHLSPLNKEETHAYIRFRLKTAGANENLFSAANIRYIREITSGIPRLINVLCDRSLLGAYIQREHKISNSVIRKSAEEVFDRPCKKKKSSFIKPFSVAASIFITLFMTGVLLKNVFQQNEIFPEAVSSAHAVTNQPVEQQEVMDKALIASPIETVSIDEEQIIRESSIRREGEISLSLSPVEQDRRRNFQHLFKLWGVEYSDLSVEPCEFAVTAQLRCWNKQAAVQTIVNLNRPVIVNVRNNDNQYEYVLIHSMDEDGFLLEKQNQMSRIDIKSLSENWDGWIQLLWKPLSSYQLIKPGIRGNVVTKLDAQLAEITDRPQRHLSNLLYDTSLINEVKSFQQHNNLQIDGVIGPITQIHLNTAARINAPVLHGDKS